MNVISNKPTFFFFLVLQTFAAVNETSPFYPNETFCLQALERTEEEVKDGVHRAAR